MQQVTYSENPDVLDWIEAVRANVSAYRGSHVRRAEVLRWLTRTAQQEYGALPPADLAARI